MRWHRTLRFAAADETKKSKDHMPAVDARGMVTSKHAEGTRDNLDKGPHCT